MDVGTDKGVETEAQLYGKTNSVGICRVHLLARTVLHTKWCFFPPLYINLCRVGITVSDQFISVG